MGEQLRKALEQKGWKLTFRPEQEQDSFPEIDVLDKEAVDDFVETSQTLKKGRYYRPIFKYRPKKEQGKVEILEVKKIMARINQDSQSYLSMKAIYIMRDPVSLQKVVDLVTREHPAAKPKSIASYLAKYVELGLATQSTIGGFAHYQRIEGLTTEIAYAKYSKYKSTRDKENRAKRLAEEEAKMKIGQDAAPENPDLGGSLEKTIMDKVADRIAAKILVEVMGRIEVIFKFEK